MAPNGFAVLLTPAIPAMAKMTITSTTPLVINHHLRDRRGFHHLGFACHDGEEGGAGALLPVGGAGGQLGEERWAAVGYPVPVLVSGWPSWRPLSVRFVDADLAARSRAGQLVARTQYIALSSVVDQHCLCG